jgi:hypothetical protein
MLKRAKKFGCSNVMNSKDLAPGTVEQSMIMLALVLCFATTLLSMQVLFLVLALAFVTFFWRAILSGYSEGGGLALFMILAVMLLALPLNIWRKPSVLAYILIEIVAVAMAFVLVSNKEAYWRASRIVLLVCQALVLVYLARTGLDDFPLEDIIPGASSNGVTSYLIILQCNYGVSRFAATQRVSLFTSAITVAICIIGFGRGSLVASLGLFAINAFYLLKQWRVLGCWWPALTMLCATFILTLIWDPALSYLDANTKLGAGFDDAARTSILQAYLGKLDAWSIMWGADYVGTGVDEEYRGNPHNSFIRAHHLYGSLYLLAVFVLVLWSVTRRMPIAVRLYGSSVLLMLLLRAFTEPILFPTLLDVFFFATCLMLGRAHKYSRP